MKRATAATISRREQSGYVAECPDLHVVTQGETLDETVANLQEAIALALDGESLEELGFSAVPLVLVTTEV